MSPLLAQGRHGRVHRTCPLLGVKRRSKLVLPEAFEAIRRKSRVTDGRVDRLVPKVVLDRSGVLAVVCEFVTAGMPQHVAVNEEGEARGLASPRDHALIAGNAEGSQPLTDEHIDACRGFTL